MNKLKKTLISLSMLCILFLTSKLYAATNISVNKSTIYPGDTFTVNINVSNIATWQLNVQYSGNIELVSGSTSLVRSDDGITNVSKTAGTLTFRAKDVGSGTITVSGNSYDQDYKSASADSKESVTIVGKPVTPPIDAGTNPPANNTKSSNNYLKILELSEDGMSPRFVKTKTNYSISVGEKVNYIEVNAKVEDSKAKVTWWGNDNLKDGANTITIQVTAENGNKKNYTVNVTKSANPEKANAYLSDLAINGYTLDPEFQAEVFEYNISSISGDIKKLDILCPTQNSEAKVEILGNEELVEGENVIKIKVTAADGVTVKEYTIKVNKEAATNIADEEQIDPFTTTPEQPNKFVRFFKNLWAALKANALLVIMYILIIVEFVQIVYLYRKLNGKTPNLENSKRSDKLKKVIEDDKPRRGKHAERSGSNSVNTTLNKISQNAEKPEDNNVEKE